MTRGWAPSRESAALLGLAGLAAGTLVAIGLTSWAPLLHHGPATGSHAAHGAAALATAAWLVGWCLMVAATMLPGSAPLVRAVGAAAARPGFVVAGFLGVWAAVGVVVVAGVAAVGALEAPPPAVTALALAGAGAYQLSAPKRRALARCRAHGRLLPPGWDAAPDPSGDALRAGLAQGLASAACCGPLMAAMALAAVGGPGPMLLAGVAMAVEAAAPWGPRLTRPIGALLIVGGMLALLMA